MKNLLLFALLMGATCASQDVPPAKKNNLEKLLKTGQAVFIENETFDADLDFTELLASNLISEGLYQGQTTSSITFRNCTFQGKVSAYRKASETEVYRAAFLSNVSFLGCTFEESVSFRAAEVHGLMDFSRSIFKKEATFEELSAYQNAYFIACNFREEVRFQNVFFLKKVSFLNAAFDKLSSFQSAIFQGEAQFGAGKFAGYADFSLTQFRDHAFFNYAEFGAKAIFNHAYFARNLDFLSTKHNRTEFNQANFLGQNRFFKSEVSGSMHFENSFFQLGAPDLTFLGKEKVIFNPTD